MLKEMENEERLININRFLRETHFQEGVYPHKTLKMEIDAQPTVDAVRVIHGRWEEIGVADYRCSRCGFRFTSADPISMFQYCRCGAKMDGVNEDVSL